MSLTRRDLLGAASATAALVALPGWARADAPSDSAAEKLLSDIAEDLLTDFPEQATGLGIDKGERAALKSRLTDKSAAGMARIADHCRERIARIDALDQTGLGDAAKIDVDVVRTAHALALEGFAFPYGDVSLGGYRNSPYVVAQNVGAFLDVPDFLDAQHSIENAGDVAAYLARMEAYADELDGETARVADAAGKGVILPDFLLAKTLKQLEIAQSGKIEDWGIVTSVADRAAKLALAGDVRINAAKIARDKIAPALQRQFAELESQKSRATHDAGAWKLPDGDAYYAWALKAGTTTTLSPDEVHQMGLRQLADLQSQMDAILKKEGFTQGSVGERMTALGKNPKYLFPNDDTGRKAIIDLLTATIADIKTRMPQAFTVLAPGNAEVRRMAPAVEPGAPGAYGGAGSIDGKVPGRLWINLRTTEIWPRYALPDLAYHETIPGHVWQGEYTFKLPLVRSLLAFNAYSEGWALYAEQLAAELGVYDDDPIGRLGYLQSLAFRACRLVVDTGLHAKRWSREQAIQWFAATNGSTVEEVQGEVDRYCSWPGQACGYKVGHTTINRLRDKAKAALGERYDFRRFNDAVVLAGGVPMTVLERVVDRYIAEAKA